MHCKTTPERHVARWHQQIGVLILTKGVFLQVRANPLTQLQLARCSKAAAPTSQSYNIGFIHLACDDFPYSDNLLHMRLSVKTQNLKVPVLG